MSTSICTDAQFNFNNGYSAINLTQLQHTTSYNGTCTILDALEEHTTNGPYLALPQDLTLVDPDWNTCTAAPWGAFDPPIALQRATALIQDPDKKPSPTPAPGSPIAPPHAPATPTAPAIDHGKSETHSATPKVDPQGPKSQDPQSADPAQSAVSSPKPDVQDPSKQTSDISDPAQSQAHDNNNDPITSTSTPTLLSADNVAQGDTQVVSNHESTDPHPVGGTSEGDPGADPGNNHEAGYASNIATNPEQSPGGPAQPLPSIGGHQIQALSGGGIVIASTTIQPGVQTTIDGTPISINENQLVVASKTIPLNPLTAESIINPINDNAISADGKAGRVSNTIMAPVPSNNALVINEKTSSIPSSPIPILTVAGQILTAAPTGFAIDGQSVLPGGSAITFARNVFSLASGNNALIVNGMTSHLPSAPVSVFRVGSQTFTAAPTGFAVGTQSVFPGGSAMLLDGTLVSLGPSDLVIGTSTVPLGSGAQAQDGALGSLIVYGFASPTGSSSNDSRVSPFAGGSEEVRVDLEMAILALLVNLGAATLAFDFVLIG